MSEAYARNSDPITSHEAALLISELPELEAEVLKALRGAGERGLILDEIMDVTGLQKVTASPRLRPLVKKGLASDTDRARKGRSGRRQMVWVAVQKI